MSERDAPLKYCGPAGNLVKAIDDLTKTIERLFEEKKEKTEKPKILCWQCGNEGINVFRNEAPHIPGKQIRLVCKTCKSTKVLPWTEDLEYKYIIEPK